MNLQQVFIILLKVVWLKNNGLEGLPWWSSGWDFVFPVQGVVSEYPAIGAKTKLFILKYSLGLKFAISIYYNNFVKFSSI